ncbi:autotransporter outer membrane beta-barrel domain-containing protein [uncultured Phascolarctobacterium sp.]|uniref:autotransporter family protein n=1 Tax=uncultured Phascolarctobacterium sp. TaxID=512296 RepID=UPI0025D1E397|nr:autotransporter outer membrane beta-barrel domain-containing protein [uncultured Phascolarctobacterium sp.]
MKKSIRKNITLGLLLSLGASALLTNGIVYATEPTKDTITITTADDPFTTSQDYTGVDEQHIQGASLANSQSTITQDWNVNGIITTDGQNVEVKFNKLQFDIAEPDDRNSYSNHVIEAVRSSETITMNGSELIINTTQKNYNGSNTTTEKSFSTGIYAKSGGTVILNTENTFIHAKSNVKNKLDASGMTADNGGAISVNGNLNVIVESGKQGYGLLTNRGGKITLNGDNNIKVTGGKDTPYMSGIRADADSAIAGNAMEFTGNSTTIEANLQTGKNSSYVAGIWSARDILFDNHKNIVINTITDTAASNTKNIGVFMTGNADLNITSHNTAINVTSTGSANSYGLRLEPSGSDEAQKAGNAYINQNSSEGATFITVNAKNASSYGLQSSANGEIKIGGAVLNVTATNTSHSQSAYGVCNDKNNTYSSLGGSIYLAAAQNNILAENKDLGAAYAVSVQNSTDGYTSISGSSHIEAKSLNSDSAYALYTKTGGTIEVNKADAKVKNTVVGRISANGTGKILLKLNGLESSLTGYIDHANAATADLGLTDKALWSMTKSSKTTNLLSEGGIIDMTADKNAFSTLTTKNLSGGDGIIKMDIDASRNTANSDKIYVDNNFSGTQYLDLYEINGYTPVGDEGVGTVLATVKNNNGTFLAKDGEGTLYWKRYELDSKATADISGNYTIDWYLKKVENTDNPTTSVDTVLASSSLNYHTWRTENDKLLQRMGELRHNGEDAKGAWFRMQGSKIERNGKFGFENKYTAYELGYDELTKDTAELKRYQGAALSYTDGNSSYSSGSGDNSNKAISFYNTEIGNKGHYLDLVFKISTMDNDFSVYDTNSQKITGDFNNTGLSLSAEYGRKNALQNGWYIEPQAQFTLGYLGGDNYTASNGVQVSQSGIKSAVGRIGFNIGKDVGSKGIIYAKANLLHEFGGGYDVTMHDGKGALTVNDSFDDTWFEYGIGAAFKTGSNNHIYFDVERSAGSDFTKNWQWNAGARWTF